MRKTTSGVALDPRQLKRLDRVARRQCTSRASIIRAAIREWLRRLEHVEQSRTGTIRE